MGLTQISEGNTAPKKLTVGEEFTAWAEQYWRLKERYEETTKDPGEKGGEACPYSYVKAVFIEKIDALIADRLAL